jgi:hypothetical protein
MEILGVLLGITISALAVLAYTGNRRSVELASIADKTLAELVALRSRVDELEKRKSNVVVAPETSGFAETRKGLRMRTWNEDIGAVEAK